MKEPRNPFKLRAAEPVVSEVTFLRLFGTKALDLIPTDNWDRVLIFQGAPGCGKTSLFRSFTPASLLALHRYRNDDDYRELYRRMEVLEMLTDSGPDVLGVLLSSEASYSSLEDLDGFDSRQRDLLFLSLLNARIILNALRGACTLKHLNYPKDLDQFVIDGPLQASIPEWFSNQFPCSGAELYQRFVEIEEDICKAIGSYTPNIKANLTGNETLFSLALMRADGIRYEGKPIANRVLIMLDNAHKLTESQHKLLLGSLLGERWPVGVWIAERLEAIAPKELFALGATSGREYVEPIRLEEYWRKRGQFENTVINIADKRARFASDFLTTDLHFGSFASYLKNELDEAKWNHIYEKASEIIENRLIDKFGKNEKYRDLVHASITVLGTPQQRVVELRTKEILLEREIKRSQLTLFPLLPDELDAKDNSSVRGVAELFIAKEFKVPFYYGISKISALASSNIEQFLALAGELFEQIISTKLLNQSNGISPEKQEFIIQKSLKVFWETIPRRVPYGDKAQQLLFSIQQFAFNETYKPTAPYAPGVTGIALSISDRTTLSNLNPLNNPEYHELLLVLSGCIVGNLLEPTIISQGQKGEKHLVLYLNRWLCCHASLPLQYGGWREIKISTLNSWLRYGFRPSGDQDVLL